MHNLYLLQAHREQVSIQMSLVDRVLFITLPHHIHRTHTCDSKLTVPISVRDMYLCDI